MGKEEQKLIILPLDSFFSVCASACGPTEAIERLLELLFHHTDSN